MSDLDQELESLVAQAGTLLAAQGRRVVFAESCTAGLVAATLARRPGISEHLCGSAVTYRQATKSNWLGVSAATLERHTAVSEAVTAEMAWGVLANTPEADVAAAVTGHLGPGAPPEQDGLIFVGLAVRDPSPAGIRGLSVCAYRLLATTRLARQQEAVACVLRRLVGELESRRQNP